MQERESKDKIEIPDPKGRPQLRVIEHSEREVLHGEEAHGRIEVLKPDGSKEIKPYFGRTVELDDCSIDFYWHLSPNGPLVAVTTTRKGRVEVGMRTDRIETTLVLPDGTVQRTPDMELTKRAGSPRKEKSEQEAVEYLQGYVGDLSAAIGKSATPEDAVRAAEEFCKYRSGLEPKK